MAVEPGRHVRRPPCFCREPPFYIAAHRARIGFAPAVSAGLTASTPGGKFPRLAEHFTARVTIASAPADAGEAERPVAHGGHK